MIKPSGRLLRVLISPRPRVSSQRWIPMQAYCVSKRPPRALFLALAIALGVVAVSAAVLPMVGGGLMRDGTYLRLLGYTPSNRGSTLTAQSATDASQSQAVLSASSAPGPTPAPPAAQVASSSPSDAPAGSQSAPASDSDRQADPVGTDVPALREVNETRDDLSNDSLDSFGFGVLPKDADRVRGAPDLMHFIGPQDNESGCSWRNEFTATATPSTSTRGCSALASLTRTTMACPRRA